MQKFSNAPGTESSLRRAHLLAIRWFPGRAIVAPLAAGGFSGSPLYLVDSGDHGLHVLKAFAAGASRNHAEWVHRVVRRMLDRGAGEIVPRLRETIDGHTLVVDPEGRIWEMAGFVDGTVVDAPEASLIDAAVRALAQVHAAAMNMPCHRPSHTAPPAFLHRITRASTLLATSWSDMLRAMPRSDGHERLRESFTFASDAFERCHGREALVALAHAKAPSLPCQVVLRDVWCDHVLFDRHRRDRVAGIIDLHAAGFDTPATDVARLLGSWMPTSGQPVLSWWDRAIDAYETVRPLGMHARNVVPMFAASGIIFGLDNWFHWTLREQRVFPDMHRVVARIDRLVATLPAALAVMKDWAHRTV